MTGCGPMADAMVAFAAGIILFGLTWPIWLWLSPKDRSDDVPASPGRLTPESLEEEAMMEVLLGPFRLSDGSPSVRITFWLGLTTVTASALPWGLGIHRAEA